MTGLRQIEPDELPALAIGTGVLGTGGGTHPYLELLNIQKLYREGRRVQPARPRGHWTTRTLFAEVGFHGRAAGQQGAAAGPRANLQTVPHDARRTSGKPFQAVMSSEIGGENGVSAAGHSRPVMDIPLLDADPRGRAFPEMQMSSFAIAGLPLHPVAMADIRDNEILLVQIRKCPVGASVSARKLMYRGGRNDRDMQAAADRRVRYGIMAVLRLDQSSYPPGRRGSWRRVDSHLDPVDAVLDAEEGRRPIVQPARLSM